MKNFEYTNNRFTKEPLLLANKAERKIELSTFNECTTISFSKDEVNGGQFSIIVNALLDIMPDTEAVIKTMREMVAHFKSGTMSSDFKQGVVWNNSRKYRMRDDVWNDGLTFEEWCSDEQIAKEYYSKRNRKIAIKKPTDKIMSLQDLLGELNDRKKI